MSRVQASSIPLFTVCALLAGCSIPVDFWEDASVNVDVPSTPVTTITSGTNLNLAKAAAEAKQVPGFQGIQIPEVEILISNVGASNAATTLSGSLTISDTSSSSFTPITMSYGSISIVNGGETSITPNAKDVQEFEQAVLAGDSFHVDFTSTVDTTPAQFELTAHVHIVVLVGT